MTPQELRIGNYIQELKTSNIMQVSAYDFVYILQKQIEVSPIHLSEEWLKRLKFEKKTGRESYEWTKDEFLIEQWGDGTLALLVGKQHVKLEHVHQLQNLYFALTGTELTLL